MKSILTLLVGLAAAFSVTAQKVENDDMYFTSKDRVKLNASTANTKVQVQRTPETRTSTTSTATTEAEAGINPTDSYSARTVNPEYSTANADKSSKPSVDYFVENYAPTGVNSNLKGNYSTSSSSYANTSNNPYYSNNSPYSRYGNMAGSPYMGTGGYPYYGSSMTMGGGYYRNPYDPWGYNPWVYGGAAYGYGNAWTYGYGSMWASPWAMYDPFYDPFYSGGSCFSFYGYNNYGYSGYGYNNGYYGAPVVVVDNNAIDGRNVAYQKRIDRSGSRMQADGTSSDGLTRGRVSANNSEPYYQRGWRSNLSSSGNGSTSSRTQWYNSDNTGTGANWGGNTSRSSLWDNSGTVNGGAFQSQSRSSWSPSDGGSRSSGSSAGSSGSSSGGHSRGRD